MAVVEDPCRAPATDDPRRRWFVAALVGALVLAIVAWVVVAHNPRVEEGSVSNRGDLRVANDGITKTRLVTRDLRKEPAFSLTVRNGGRLPFTIMGPAGDGATEVLREVSFRPVTYGETPPLGGRDAHRTKTMRLSPGEEAEVQVRLGAAPCLQLEEGDYIEIESFPLRVRHLGIETTQELPLPLPLAITGPLPPLPGADCS